MQLITFEQMPFAVSQLLFKIENIEQLLSEKRPPTNNESEDLITIQQAATFLKLSVHTIYGLVSRVDIPSMKKGKRLYFSKQELNGWIKTGKKKTVAEIESEADNFLSTIKKRTI